MADSKSHSTPPSVRHADEWWLRAVFVLILGGAAWMLTRSWHASILDRYEFRQLQTALSIFWMKQAGLRLDYLTPLFGPPWSIPMEFPIYQWIVALLSNGTGWGLEPTGRFVGLLFFAATLPALYGLLAVAALPPARRLLVLVVIITTPVFLFYPRTVMIESTALCFAVWFLYSIQRMLAAGSGRWFAAACGFALLAALTKITTYAVFCLPAAALTVQAMLRRRVLPKAIRVGLLAAVPVILALGATLWWVAHGDALKHSNPLASFLGSYELRLWNYGAWPARFDPAFWQKIASNVSQNILSEGALALALLCATFATAAARRIALVCLASFLVGPLIFANLYQIHDYYYFANALFLTGATGLLLASAWDNPRLSAVSRWTLLGVLLLLQYQAFDRGYHFYYWKEAPPPPDLATIMRETIPADGVVLISGADWSPLLPYYAQRRAIMLTEGREADDRPLDAVLAQLPPLPLAAMVLSGDLRHDENLIRTRTARFGFFPRAFASSEDADLYLPVAAISAAAARLQDRPFKTAHVRFVPDLALPMATSIEQDLAAKDYPMCSPAPRHSRSQFGISPGLLHAQPVIYTHAPSELYFQPAAGMHGFAAIVGMMDIAFANPPPQATDGIVVEIFEQQADGLRRSLIRRTLTPATQLADRGPQQLSYENGTPFTGQLVFTLSPGPANDLAYDQSYWGRIALH
ncbi:MAG: hypothetical protein KA257_01220 [Opitutaceae bacterium]|nr:hypothetical protein [Opitutaceae bacterium]MBP9912825.1 hypothetical protein [Opitutaceae bacterium]